MPSIFSRARTSSAKKLPKSPADTTDEFGRVTSRGAPKTPKDKRPRTQSSAEYRLSGEPDATEALQDGFLPTSVDENDIPTQAYGYLSHATHVVLGIDDVTRLVEIVSEEIGQRELLDLHPALRPLYFTVTFNVAGLFANDSAFLALTTPFLFSNTAIDISPPGVKRLINAFLGRADFRDECRFAGPHDLGMILRWGLARVVRVVNGQEMRGLVHWESYLTWREDELASHFPATEFTRFIPLVPTDIRSLVLTLFSLLTRLVANSTSSGLTPLTLSSLFGPLLFGIGHLSLAFHHAYAAYLRSAHATEHLLLAFIRLQDAQAMPSTPIPSRLKSWIKGYPSMLAPLERLDRPRRGVRTVRITSVRRNVRLYSPDLVRSCAAWAKDASGPGDLRAAKEWQRIAPASPGAPHLPPLPPRYSDAYRKKMDLPSSFHPDLGHGPASALSTTSSTTSTVSNTSTLVDDKEFGYSGREGENRFRSLTDMKWGAFEELGFGDADTKKLEFDLNESARNARTVKRTTLTWADFSSSGFTRNEPTLSSTLQFDAPLANTITEWPTQAAEMQRKLKKTQKALPAFGWDTAPVMGGEEVIEESFLDVFCDLIYGGGWMDRAEGTFRDCNWALVEFKSLGSTRQASGLGNDPRTATSILLFEEFVPFEYRSQLLSQGEKPSIRKRLPSLFSPAKSKAWKPAATLNGRPYVVGSVPRSPTAREVEFEGLLRGGPGVTKIITLDQASRSQSQLKVQSPAKPERKPIKTNAISSPLFTPSVSSPMKSSPLPTDSPSAKKSRFRFPTSSGASNRHGMIMPAEYDTVDFETRLASYSDDELNNADSQARTMGLRGKHEKRRSRDDAWVDILVAGHGQRMESQDAELRPPRNVRGLRGGRSDPELASQEVAQALAAVQRHHPLSDDDEPGREPERGRAAAMLPEPLDEEEVRMPTLPRKRPGYFDLHPDRKPRSPEAGPVMDDEDMYGKHDDAAGSTLTRDTAYSDADFEPADDEGPFGGGAGGGGAEEQDIEVPAFVNDEQHRFYRERGHAKSESTTLPVVGHSPAGTPSKTAALIEMYREKEKTIFSPIPSRLPVRSQAVHTPTASLSPPRTTPSPLLPVDPRDSPPIFTPDSDSDSGRSSPLRYKHGAPLHNVVEEQDEEVHE